MTYEDAGFCLRNDHGHGPFHWLKLLISLDLNILNIWDNMCTQVSKIYNTVLVAFVYLNKNIVHIVPLIRISRFVMLALTKKKLK